MNLNKNLEQVSSSLTLLLAAKAKELKKSGKDVVSFTVGEPDFPTPSHIKEAAIKAINDNFVYYTPATGIPELKEAIVAKFKKDNELEYTVKNIAVSNGAKHSISNVLFALINPGDEIITPSPYWLSYADMVHLCGGKNVLVPTTLESGYKITAEQLEQAITAKTKALILNSPNNPSGAVYSREELQKIASVIEKTGISVISDEIYEKLIYEGEHISLAQFPEIKEQTIVVNGVSKAYSMTGWRIGYIAANTTIIDAVDKIQSQFTSCPSSISQKAALAALTMTTNDVENMRTAFAKRRDFAYDLLLKIPDIRVTKAPGAFYLFPEYCGYGKSYEGQAINNSDDLAKCLVENYHVVVVPGTAFGADNNFRISYATSEEQIQKGIERIGEALAKLK